MKTQQLKMGLSALWVVSLVVIMFITGRLSTMADFMVLAGLAVAPPAAMWFWWNDPAETLSESIHAAREEDAATRSRRGGS